MKELVFISVIIFISILLVNRHNRKKAEEETEKKRIEAEETERKRIEAEEAEETERKRIEAEKEMYEILRVQAEEGDAEVQYKLGVLLMERKEYEEARNWFHRAGIQGHLEAQSKRIEAIEKLRELAIIHAELTGEATCICGKSYLIYSSSANTKYKYCSKECQDKYQSDEHSTRKTNKQLELLRAQLIRDTEAIKTRALEKIDIIEILDETERRLRSR